MGESPAAQKSSACSYFPVVQKKREQIPLLSSCYEPVWLRISREKRLPCWSIPGKWERMVLCLPLFTKEKLLGLEKDLREKWTLSSFTETGHIGGGSWNPHPGCHNRTQLNDMVTTVTMGHKILCTDIFCRPGNTANDSAPEMDKRDTQTPIWRYLSHTSGCAFCWFWVSRVYSTLWWREAFQ